MEPIISINHLSKSFKEIKAVQDLSFRIYEGELFAFLGVNGAGKSTTISILCGQLSKDAGEVYINHCSLDENLEHIKKDLGVVFQNSLLDKPLTVYDNLKSRAALYGISGKEFEMRLQELDALLSLQELYKRTVGKLSGGQRRRVDIARAILHHPKILILDEPTTGLDPQTRKTIWNVIEKLRQETKMTVLLTTHYMEEAANADYVVMIDHGKRVAEGTPLDLKNQYVGDFITVYHVKEERIKALSYPYQSVQNGFKIEVKNTNEAKELILKYPDLFEDFEITKGNMDDVFLAVTGKTLTGEMVR